MPTLKEEKGNTRYVTYSIFVILFSFLLHLYLAVHLPLDPDETYYWEWSRRLAWGYYDQGPAIAALIHIFCELFGDTALGVRAGIILCMLGVQIYLFLLAKAIYDSRIAFWSVLLISFTPLATVGGFVSTYDTCLIFCWAACLYHTYAALFEGGKTQWILAGIAFGIGMLSKDSMGLFAVCLLCFLAIQPTMRHWLARPEPYMAFILGIVIFSPNLMWQSQHQWMTFSHLIHISRTSQANHFLREFGDYAGSQAILLTPLLFIGFLYSGIIASVHWRKDENIKEFYLACFSIPVLLFFTLLAVKSKVQGNWAACAWLTPAILYSVATLKSEPHRKYNPMRSRGFMVTAFFVSFAMTILAAFPRIRSMAGVKLPMKMDKINKMYGGTELAHAVSKQIDAMQTVTGRTPVIGAATYDIASRLAFYLPSHPHTRCFFLSTRANSYLLWNDESGLKPGRDAVVVDNLSPSNPKFPPYRAIFKRVVLVRRLEIYRKPWYVKPIETYYIYRCFDYKPNPAVEVTKGG